MTTINDAFPKPHLKAHDLGGRARVLTVSRFMMKELYDRKEKKRVPKPVLYFQGATKYLCLTPTTWEQIVTVTGEETAEKWVGKNLELYPTQETHGGDTWQVIRIRKPSQPAPAAQPAPRKAEVGPAQGNDPQQLQEAKRKEYRRLVDMLGITDEDGKAIYLELGKDFEKACEYLRKEYADQLDF